MFGRRVPGVAAVSAPFGRDVEACFDRIATDVASARARGASLVVFPESAVGGYVYEPPVASPSLDRLVMPPAFRRDDPALVKRLVALAGETTVCVGYTEADGDVRYSSAICVSGDGVLGHQRKVHVPAGERGCFDGGQEGFSAFDTPVGRIGMLVCYDKVFPEAAGTLARQGAQLIASLAAWPVCRLRPSVRVGRDREVRHFNLLDEARAVENQVVWVSANQTGRLGRLRFPGQSKVVDPDGQVLARTGSRAGVALARVDVAHAVGSLRAEISHLADAVALPAAPPLRAVA